MESIEISPYQCCKGDSPCLDVLDTSEQVYDIRIFLNKRWRLVFRWQDVGQYCIWCEKNNLKNLVKGILKKRRNWETEVS